MMRSWLGCLGSTQLVAFVLSIDPSCNLDLIDALAIVANIQFDMKLSRLT